MKIELIEKRYEPPDILSRVNWAQVFTAAGCGDTPYNHLVQPPAGKWVVRKYIKTSRDAYLVGVRPFDGDSLTLLDQE